MNDGACKNTNVYDNNKKQYFADVNLGRVLLMGESFQDYSWIQDVFMESQPQSAE